MILHASNYRENSTNTLYPHAVQITSAADLAKVVARDHMASGMSNNYRSEKNYISADCIMFDVDNTHTEEPDAWKSLDDILETFPVKLYIVRSRNYMKQKTKVNTKTGEATHYAPREKWHIYCPLRETITDSAAFDTFMLDVQALFPFIDDGARDCARFFYGVESPHVTEEDGPYLDDYLKSLGPGELQHEQQTALDSYIAAMQAGIYADTKATRNYITKLCTRAGMKSPFVTAAPQTQQSQQAPAAQDGETAPEWIRYAEQEKALRWLEEWAGRFDVDLSGKRYRISATDKNHPEGVAICIVCPWEEDHSMNGAENETVIIIDLDGKYNFLCRHSHGAALSWKDYRAKVETDYNAEHTVREYDLHDLPLDAFGEEQTAPDTAQAPESVATPPADKTPEALPETPQTPQENYLQSFYERIQTEQYKPYKTELPWFDFLLSGGPLRQTVLLFLAAPAAGKTTLAQQIGECMAMNGKPVVYINLEMSKDQMIAKSISARATLKGCQMTVPEVLQGYNWTDQQRETVKNALDDYRKGIGPNMAYPPRPLPDLENLRGYITNVANYMKNKGREAPVVILDYLHLVTVQGAKDLQEGIKQTILALKEYAMRYDTFCIAISATNRDSNKDGRITRDSGRDSSNIEYTGDYILSLNYYQIDKGAVSTRDLDKIAVLEGRDWRQMIVRVLKNRWGVSGRSARVYLHAPGSRFYAEHDAFIPVDVVAFDEYDKELEFAGETVNTLTGPDGKGLEFALPENQPKKAHRRR